MKTKHYLFTLLSCVLFQVAQAVNDDPTDNARFGYIENKGQMVDQNGNARNDIRFMYYDDQFKLTLRNNGFSYEFVRTDYLLPKNTESGTPKDIDDEGAVEYTPQYTVNRIDIDFMKPNSNVQVISDGTSPFYRNYFNEQTGYKGIKRIHSFNSVTYKNIYNNIDLIFSSEKKADGKIYPKYEFVVHPGGNIADIALNYKGDFQFTVSSDNGLKLNTTLGYVEETQPIILFGSDRASEKGKFIRHGSIVSFGNIKHSANETITIDPTCEWGTYWGGNQKDLTDEMSVDHEQNIYVTGRTRSNSHISTSGAYQEVFAGGMDVPLMKWDPSGNLIYCTYYGGSDNEIGFCIAVDIYDQPWIGGHTFSVNGIATSDAMQGFFVGPDYDGLFSKWSPDGDLLYGTYFGGTGEDEFQGLWADDDGSIYGSGFAESLTGIIFSPCYDCVGSSHGAIVICKFDNYGNQVWATYWGGQGRDRGHGITTYKNNLYICGTGLSDSAMAYGNNIYQSHSGGINDVFLARWNKTTGAPIWVTYYGGANDDRGRDVRCDLDGYIYFTGQAESNDSVMSTPGAWKRDYPFTEEDKDGYAAKWDSDCHRIWGTYIGGDGIDFPRSLRIDPYGAPIYISGYTKSRSGFTTSDAFDNKNKKNNDAFWLRLNWNGTVLQYSTYFGGTKSESVTDPGWYGPTMELDANNNVYLSSGTNSSDGIAYGNSFKDTLAHGEYDFFVAKFPDPCPDGFEPNDNLSQATQLRFRGTNTINWYAPLQVKKDKDYYTFTTTADQSNLKIDLSNLPYDANLFLYDSNGSQIGSSSHTGTVSESIVKNGTYIGKYSLLVKSPTSEFLAGVCYSLTVNASSTPFRLPDEIVTSQLGSLSLYPNPSSQSAELQFDFKQDGVYNISICNLQGKVLIPITQPFSVGEQTFALPVEKLSSGNYLVKVNGPGLNDVVKMIIQK